MTYIMASEFSKWAMEAYDNTMEEISRAQAEGDIKNELLERRAEAIDAFTDKLVASGKVSQQDMMELETLSSQEAFLGSHGVALEHFTRVPSRTNMKIALEMSELLKGGLIGAAVAVGAFVLYKLFKIIWDFFTKKETAEEKAKKDAESWLKELSKMQSFLDLPKNERDTLMKLTAKSLGLDEAYTWQCMQAPENRYTELMHKVFTENEEVTHALLDAFQNMKVHQSIMTEAKKAVDLYPGAGASEINATDMTKYIESTIKPLLANERINDLNAFHEKYDEVLTNAKEWAKETHPLQLETIDDFFKLLMNKNWESVFNDFRTKQQLDVYGKLVEDSKKDFEKFKENADKFEKQDTAGMTEEQKKEATNKIKEMFKTYQKCVAGFANLMGVYILLQSQYHGFMQGYLTRWKADTGNIAKCLKAMKADEAKAFEQIKKDWKIDQ